MTDAGVDSGYAILLFLLPLPAPFRSQPEGEVLEKMKRAIFEFLGGSEPAEPPCCENIQILGAADLPPLPGLPVISRHVGFLALARAARST